METRKMKVDIMKTTEILDISEIPQLCRVCLCNDGKMTQIFESKRINVVDKVQYCTGVLLTKEANLPTLICNKCLRDLAVAFRLKTRFLQSSETLQNSLASVKNETQLRMKIKDEAVSETSTSEQPPISESFVECVVTVNEDSGVVKSETEDEDDINEGKKSEEDKGKNEVSPSTNEKTKPSKRVRSTRKIAGDKKRKPKVTKFRKLYCEPCDIKFSTKRESDEHKKALHTNPGAWMCDMCGKAFAHRPSLYTHVRSHLPPRHPCDRCEYKAWSKSDLDKHTRIHTGNRQYQCEFCSSAFFTSSNLACHIRRSHEGVKRFPCTRCERAFFDATELRRHMDAHNDVKRHECEVCHACFTRRRYWKRHLERQHSVVVPPQRPGRKKTNFLVETSSAAASL